MLKTREDLSRKFEKKLFKKIQFRPVISRPFSCTLSGRCERNDEDKFNMFVEHLKNIFTLNVSNDIIILSKNTLVKPPFLREIDKAIIDLNPKKAPGIYSLTIHKPSLKYDTKNYY